MTEQHVQRQTRILAMTAELGRDSIAALHVVFTADSPMARRQLFRSVFAEIEGTVFGYKYLAVAGHEIGGPPMSDGELAIAREVTFDLSDKGEPVTRSARLRFAPNLLFALRVVARFFKPGWQPFAADHRWEALKSAARVRDRLMHPKSIEDLSISRDELVALAQGYDWFTQTKGDLFDAPLPRADMIEDLIRTRIAR